MSKNIDRVIAIAVSAFGVTVSLGGTKDSIIKSTINYIPASFHFYYELIFDIAIVMSVLILAITLVLIFYKIYRSLFKIDLSLPTALQSIQHCSEADLLPIIELASEIFSGRSSSYDQLKSLFEYTPSSFWCIRNNDEVIGYFIIFTLKKAGEKAILGNYYTGSNPAREHISRSSATGEALCVAAIVATGLRARAACLGAMEMLVKQLPHRRIYAKPLTDSGLRLIRDYAFKRVDGDQDYMLDKYYVLERGDYISKPRRVSGKP